ATQVDARFEAIASQWGQLDILVHSIAFAPRRALEARVTDCPRDGFLTAMDVSCWSLLDLTRRAEKLMTSGGTIFAMSYHGANEVIENYGIMGPVKAALEAAVRYLAAELGPRGIRVHAVSPGPLATRAASGIPDFDMLMSRVAERAPARRLVRVEEGGAACAVLCGPDGAALAAPDFVGEPPASASEGLATILPWLREQLGGRRLAALGHRVVHGGLRHSEPALVTPKLLGELEDLVPLAPLHEPHNL